MVKVDKKQFKDYKEIRTNLDKEKHSMNVQYFYGGGKISLERGQNIRSAYKQAQLRIETLSVSASFGLNTVLDNALKTYEDNRNPPTKQKFYLDAAKKIQKQIDKNKMTVKQGKIILQNIRQQSKQAKLRSKAIIIFIGYAKNDAITNMANDLTTQELINAFDSPTFNQIMLRVNRADSRRTMNARERKKYNGA